MKSVYHKANTRGYANLGWLDTYHTFSFADYYDPDRMGFGVLRVINDDTVKGGKGFGWHSHKDMEIISIPLEGDLKHEDSMGHEGIIRKGEVQVMSAGTGIVHSEMNANSNEEVNFLQIWIIPNKYGVQPRYDQITIDDQTEKNNFQQILFPNKAGKGLWIHQDAWFYLGNFDQRISEEYILKNIKDGVYVFVIRGKVKIGDQILEKRDGYGISEVTSFSIEAIDNSEILIMEIPMELPD